MPIQYTKGGRPPSPDGLSPAQRAALRRIAAGAWYRRVTGGWWAAPHLPQITMPTYRALLAAGAVTVVTPRSGLPRIALTDWGRGIVEAMEAGDERT